MMGFSTLLVRTQTMAYFQFSEEQAERLMSLAIKKYQENGWASSSNWQKICVALQLSNSLPLQLSEQLYELRLRISKEPFLVIKGLFTHHDYTTPTEKNFNSDWLEYIKIIHLTLSVQVGIAYFFKNKKDQYLVENIFPIRENHDKQINSNSVQLHWHVEDDHSSARSDFVSLSCLREDISAKTLVSCVKDWNLSANTINTLAKEQFQIKMDTTFKTEGNKNIAVLSDGGVIYDPAFMQPLTPQADLAFKELGKEIERTQKEIVLKTGDMLLFDNKKLVHGRSPYYPKYDGTDRWLLRSIMLSDLFDKKVKFDKTLCAIQEQPL